MGVYAVRRCKRWRMMILLARGTYMVQYSQVQTCRLTLAQHASRGHNVVLVARPAEPHFAA